MKLYQRQTSWRRLGQGMHGTYYKISHNEGIKIIGFPRKTIAELEATNYDNLAMKEARLLKAANKKSMLIPRSYGAVQVDMGEDGFYFGILMEHINGKTLKSIAFKTGSLFRWQDKDWYPNQISSHLYGELKKVGIFHDDLHSNLGNVMVKIKNTNEIVDIKVIDFDPELVYINERA